MLYSATLINTYGEVSAKKKENPQQRKGMKRNKLQRTINMRLSFGRMIHMGNTWHCPFALIFEILPVSRSLFVPVGSVVLFRAIADGIGHGCSSLTKTYNWFERWAVYSLSTNAAKEPTEASDGNDGNSNKKKPTTADSQNMRYKPNENDDEKNTHTHTHALSTLHGSMIDEMIWFVRMIDAFFPSHTHAVIPKNIPNNIRFVYVFSAQRARARTTMCIMVRRRDMINLCGYTKIMLSIFFRC